jgi:RNA polymerase sigma factor (sigma-70 family)
LGLSWAEAYAKWAEDLVRFATGLVGPADASDVVSDAMVRVLRSANWDVVASPRAYLMRSVLNEARMHHRSTLRRRVRESQIQTARLVETPDVRPEVLEAVARLSMRQRAVVMLTYWDDLDAGSVAELLGVSAGAVRRHLARAHTRLRGMIDAT